MPKEHKQQNKHLSASEKIEKPQPLDFQHSFRFLAKSGLSKCHTVAKNLREDQLRNMNEIYFEGEGTRLLLVLALSLKAEAVILNPL